MCNEGNGADCPLREAQLRAVHLNPEYWSMQIWTWQLALCGALFSRNGTPWEDWDTENLSR